MSNVDVLPALLGTLKGHWDDDSTSWGGTPRFKDAWYENDDSDWPHVVLFDPLETPLGGGQTGFTALSAGSGRPMTRVIGNLSLATLAHNSMDIGAVDAATLAKEMSDEVRRIVSETYLDPVEGVHWWSFYSRAGVQDTVRRPVIYRQECQIRYSYDYRV